MVDIFEYAVVTISDFKRFEVLSTEMMKIHGYSGIIAMGGMHDDGIDATMNSFHNNDTKTTIFQFSTENNPKKKINNTIEKLKGKGIVYHELVYVTNRDVTNKRELITDARSKHKVILVIYDLKDFTTELGSNIILRTRYFPDLNAQLKNINETNLFKEIQSDKEISNSLLKCSLMFVTSNKANKQRKALLDDSLLVLIYNYKSLNIVEIKEKYKLSFKRELDDLQIKAILQRLIDKKKVQRNSNDKYILTQTATQTFNCNLVQINNKSDDLIENIIDDALSVGSLKIDRATRVKIKTNTINSLVLYFRLVSSDFGFPLKEEFNLLSSKSITDALAKGLDQKVVNAILERIGLLLRMPTVDEKEILNQWAKAFILSEIMLLDPVLKNFQLQSLKNKKFILDTDFVLYCIVKETNQNHIYLKLVNTLLENGCKVIIPKEVIYEISRHSEFAIRNYIYFRDKIGKIDDVIIEEKVQNVFVKGYLKQVQLYGLSHQTFSSYINNYSDKRNPYNFTKRVIEETFNNKIVIDEFLLETENKRTLYENIKKEILQITSKTHKGHYRSDDENEAIASTDTKLFLYTYYKNEFSEVDNSLLKNDYYLLTNTTKSIRAAKRFSINESVTIKPNNLINILSEIGYFEPGDDFNLFDIVENPYLATLLENSWDSITDLLNFGLDLRNKSIVRLQTDYENEFHEMIIKSDDSDDLSITESLYDKFEQKGYKPNTEFQELINEIKNLKEDLNQTKLEVELLKNVNSEKENQLTQKDEFINIELAKFGKRRQKFLKRLSQKK